jgi:hypothetical protein
VKPAQVSAGQAGGGGGGGGGFLEQHSASVQVVAAQFIFAELARSVEFVGQVKAEQVV